MARVNNLNAWNQSRGETVPYIGKNGIHYEYILKKQGNRDKFYEDAIDVRSRNKDTGRYQPIGDKRYFNFYQLKKMNLSNSLEEYTVKIVVD